MIPSARLTVPLNFSEILKSGDGRITNLKIVITTGVTVGQHKVDQYQTFENYKKVLSPYFNLIKIKRYSFLCTGTFENVISLPN